MAKINIYPFPSCKLEAKIGYIFKDKGLLETALTHSSYSNELKARGMKLRCNERLEFLGDSVLSIIVSEYLFSKYSGRKEGDLTKIRASVVCEKALAKFSEEISLGDYLKLGHGEEINNGRRRASINADAFEALLAAMYLDSGKNIEVISKFLLPFVISEIDYIGSSASFVDYKTALQQIIQQVEGEILEYVLVGETGPDHRKTFTVEARLNSNVIGHGSGPSKRIAEQEAAKEALKLFGSAEPKI